MESRRPAINDHFESNVPGLFVVGDLAGASVVKLAMDQGFRAIQHIAAQTDARSNDPAVYDVLIIGAGAAGLNAAFEAKKLGLRSIVIEKNQIASTIADLPEGKVIYAEPNEAKVAGSLWFEEASKEDLLARWQAEVTEHGLEVRTGEEALSVSRGRTFSVKTSRGIYQTKRILLATGKGGNPRKLGVPGEDGAKVHYQLYNPKSYKGASVLVVGGGNSAVEAAVALAEQSQVTLSYRGAELYRVSKENRRRLEDAIRRGSIETVYSSQVSQFDEATYRLNGQDRAYDHAFVLIGSEPPVAFLRALGLRLENDWTWPRFAILFASFLIAYTIYGVKQAPGHEFWPYRGWGAQAFAFFDRPWSFWYTVLYTAVMTIFGIQAMKRWGFDRKDRFQIWRYVSLIGFQWVFFFLIPEFLFQWAVKYQWVGAQLAADPSFAQNAWRSYGLVYAWPLFFYTFIGNPHQIWIWWGLILSFGIIPVLALFHGKRYCSWICGCGGLAETLGDRWRHLAPKGAASIRWERMNLIVLAAAAVITIMLVTRDALAVFRAPSEWGRQAYYLIADVWLVGILPVALYPFFGGKVWCRYWCPLAKMMEFFSAAFTRWRISRFAIHANEKCIACGECTRNCQVGIDVMRFALKQEELNNVNSSCIGCGICVTVCPMHVLSFEPIKGVKETLVQIRPAA